jgi:hypothetical protein
MSGLLGTDKRPYPMSPDILIDVEHLHHFALGELGRQVAEVVKRPNWFCYSKI